VSVDKSEAVDHLASITHPQMEETAADLKKLADGVVRSND
jgi:hypothetical protein